MHSYLLRILIPLLLRYDVVWRIYGYLSEVEFQKLQKLLFKQERWEDVSLPFRTAMEDTLSIEDYLQDISS